MENPPKSASFLDWLQRLLLIAASISGILVVSGYIVVNGAFALYRIHMPLYTVLVTQYIAAGIYFLFNLLIATGSIMFIVWYLVKAVFYFDQYAKVVETYLPGLWSLIAIYISFVFLFLPNRQFVDALVAALTSIALLFVVGVALVFIIRNIEPPVFSFLTNMKIQFPPVGRLVTRVRCWISRTFPGWQKYLVVALPFSLIYSMGQCISSYMTTPPFLGGGQPMCVNLLFKDAKNVALLGLTPHLPQNVKTDKVKILAIMNDGLLVIDDVNARVVEVKNDLIDGYVRCEPLEGYLSATPTPAAALPGTNVGTQAPTMTTTQPATGIATPP